MENIEQQQKIAQWKASQEAARLIKETFSEQVDAIKPCFEKVNGVPVGLISFFRKGKNVVKVPDENGKLIVAKKKKGDVVRTKGHKKGVFMATIEKGTKRLIIGFSMCHPNDRFDYHSQVHVPGLGLLYAMNKAVKYSNSDSFVITTSDMTKQLPKEVVKIPQSMSEDLEKFIARCKKFFAGCELPPWAEGLLSLDKIECDCLCECCSATAQDMCELE